MSQLTNSIQPQKYLKGGVNGGTLHRAWEVNANWNPNYGDWNVNVNSVANLNEWNAGNQVLSKLFSFKGPDYRAFVCFRQPPSIEDNYKKKNDGKNQSKSQERNGKLLPGTFKT